MRRIVYIFSAIVVFFICCLFGFLVYSNIKIPESYYRYDDDDLCVENFSYINLLKKRGDLPVGKNFFSFVNNEQFIALLFNLIPIKNVTVQNYGKKIFVQPCGAPFGLKILTDGVLVVDLKKINTAEGEKSPADEADLKKGDVLLSANGHKISGCSQFRSLVQKNQGKAMKLKVRRNSSEFETEIEPVLAKDRQQWCTGVLVRDSYAGLGTLTFIKGNHFGGLGHAVYDSDVGDSLSIGSGEIVDASIDGVVKGSCSKPGELCGNLKTNKPIGNIKMNTECGVYGSLYGPLEQHEPVPLGLKQEVKVGKAYIYSTVDEDGPKKYEVEIKSIDYQEDYKNYVIEIVDEELLSKTGGIVQGMSGSPIIQDGKFVGAITHVFLNDPTKGYGVFGEAMITDLQEIVKFENF